MDQPQGRGTLGKEELSRGTGKQLGWDGIGKWAGKPDLGLE